MSTFEIINKNEIPNNLPAGKYEFEFVKSFFSLDRGKQVFQFKFTGRLYRGVGFPLVIH